MSGNLHTSGPFRDTLLPNVLQNHCFQIPVFQALFGVTQTLDSDKDNASPYLVIKKTNQDTTSFSSTCTERVNLPAGIASSVLSHFPQASPSNHCLPRLLSFITQAVGGQGGGCWIFAELLHLSGSSLQKPPGLCPPIDPRWKLFILATFYSSKPTPRPF